MRRARKGVQKTAGLSHNTNREQQKVAICPRWFVARRAFLPVASLRFFKIPGVFILKTSERGSFRPHGFSPELGFGTLEGSIALALDLEYNKSRYINDRKVSLVVFPENAVNIWRRDCAKGSCK